MEISLSMKGKDLFKGVVFDRSLAMLLFADAVAIVFAVIERWDLASMMWVYWAQSLIIGFFQFLRIFRLKQFSTEGLRITVNNRPADPSSMKPSYYAFILLFSLGLFHLIYAVVLFSGFFQYPGPSHPSAPVFSWNWFLVALSILTFFSSHLFSYIQKRKRDAEYIPTVGRVFFFLFSESFPCISSSYSAHGSSASPPPAIT